MTFIQLFYCCCVFANPCNVQKQPGAKSGRAVSTNESSPQPIGGLENTKNMMKIMLAVCSSREKNASMLESRTTWEMDGTNHEL